MTINIQDDKAQHVIPFIISQLQSFQESNNNNNNKNKSPFFIGLNGVQGAGKSVLVDIIQTHLQSEPYNLPTVVFSLDDLYLTHEDQIILAQANPNNPLLQHRGQPSTHDTTLALETFTSLKANQPTKIPNYNKAAFSGQGDRTPTSEWKTVNTDPKNPIRIVLFEGWCVGFKPLPQSILERKHADAFQTLPQSQNPTSTTEYKGRLAHNTLQSITTINNALADYDAITNQLDAFIHIDAQDPQFVYKWRLEQEQGLRFKKGSGMTDDQVRTFVDGYYPAYELYTEGLREGVFKYAGVSVGSGGGEEEEWKGKQLRLVVGEDRKVVDVVRI